MPLIAYCTFAYKEELPACLLSFNFLIQNSPKAMTKHDLESVIQHFRFWMSPEFPPDFKIGITCLRSLLKNTLFFSLLKCGEDLSCLYTAEHKLLKIRINFKTEFLFFKSRIFCSTVTG